MSKLVIVGLLLLAIYCGRLPSPTCRPGFLPSVIPISIGQTARVDLENLFDGYNLVFDGIKKDHITLTPKYQVNQTQFQSSLNFSTAKIKDHNRFLGLITRDHFTQLALGTNHPESGVKIDNVIKIQDLPQLHCYDVDEIVDRQSNKAYAIIDCGIYRMGELTRNQFLFVDLGTNKLIIGSRMNDVFVRYNHLKSRYILPLFSPQTRTQYIARFYTVDGVDTDHSDQTYVQIFMNNQNIMSLQIIDVIDHTLLGLPSLSILDFQIHMNYIYLLVKDSGLYQIEFTPTQRLIRRSFFPIKMNVNRFYVQQNGFNDDLHLIFSNDNTVYQFTWDVTLPPVLVTKYNLMANSVVQDLLMDEDFVIVQVWENVDQQIERRTWVFSRRTNSYMNAFGSFKEPSFGPSILIYIPFDRTLHLIHEYRTFNIKLNLPYLTINPVSTQKAGDTQNYLVKAVSSTGEGGSSIQCRLQLNFIYIQNTDTRIIKTGLQGRNETFVDAPDDASYNLEYQFFGRNISYEHITKNVDPNSTVVPQSYVEKKVKAKITFPPQIDQSRIIYYEMFLQNTLQQVKDRNQIFGVVQVSQINMQPIYYIRCEVQADAEFVNPSIRCRTVSKNNYNMGKVLIMSQMYSTKQRVGAIVFSDEDHSVYLFYFHSTGFELYGHKKFGFDFANIMTGLQVTLKRQLIVVFEYGKRIQVYKLEDLHRDQQRKPMPIMTIDSRIMAFFGVQYFSPIKVKVSIYHDEVTFLQTKTGLMALNINELGFPQLLFNIRTTTSKFDFEVNQDTLIIITQNQMLMYRLTVPLRRRNQPLLLQTFKSDFNLKQYDEINSDGLFYLVQAENSMLLVVHPDMPSTSVIYTEFYIGNILMLDAVRLNDKQVIFVYNGTQILTYMFAENPRLRIKWTPDQVNFTLEVSAYNQKSKSEPYTTLYSIIESNQAQITTTQKFNATAIRRSGYVQTKKNSPKVNLNITLNDTQWFKGNIMHFYAKCASCNRNISQNDFSISLQNHLKTLNTQIKVGEPVYDMHATFNGIYGQMFSAAFKTFSTNDSIDYIITIPTLSRGQVCTKLAVNPFESYFISFCETGGQVNAYITTTSSFKPFTFGPFETEAKSINHVEIVGNIIMIVDNDDDPMIRAGGVYLYYLDIAAVNPDDVFTMLDYLDYADLQIEGFRGVPHIASADIHKPLFNRDEYAVFITQARTGNIFVFLFELSGNKQQAVYLQRRMIQLNRLIPESIKHPTPLRVININIIDYTVKIKPRMQIEYVLLLTVKNWHHIELMMLFDEDYDLKSFQLTRLFERVPYPWQLTNFIRLRKGSLNASYFAVSYRDFQAGSQLMVIYQLPYFALSDKKVKDPKAGPPITTMLAAHRVQDTGQMCYDFNIRNEHRLLFNDVRTPHLSQLQFNKELKLIIKNANPAVNEGQNITIIAQNHYTNISFLVEFKFNFDKDDDDDGDKTKNEIIWIIILVIGFVVIVGLIFVWSRQVKQNRESANIKQSLLTVQPEFKNNYINRSSADPESVRDTVDYGATTTLTSQKLQKQAQNNPLSEQIEEPNQEEALQQNKDEK